MIHGVSAVPFTIDELEKISKELFSFLFRVYPYGPQWMGQMPMQWPCDLMTYQEILVSTKPSIVVECGTASGITPLFLDDIYTLMKLKGIIDNWKIITIDIRDTHVSFPETIEFILGRSVDIVEKIKSRINNADKVMVMLDSQHNAEYVFQEMELYAPLVTVGCYMVVEDGSFDIVSGQEGNHPGPLGAVEKYLELHDDFVIDFGCQRWGATQHYKGYLRKVK